MPNIDVKMPLKYENFLNFNPAGEVAVTVEVVHITDVGTSHIWVRLLEIHY